MKGLIKTEALILGSTLLLVFYVRSGIPVPVEGDPEGKSTCTGQEPVGYEEICELPQNSSCYLPCSTFGAMCLKPKQKEHHHHAPEAVGDNEQPKDKVMCICPEGTTIDEDRKNCSEIMEKREQNESASPPEQSDTGHAPDDAEGKTPGETPDDPPADVETKSADSNTTEPSASVHSVEKPNEAAKSKSNVGLAIGIITLTMFAMIFVFLVRNKINNAVRRMCGGSHPVPTSEN